MAGANHEPGAAPEYRSARTFALGATRWFGLQIVASLVVLGIDIHEYTLRGDPLADEDQVASVGDLNTLLSTILLISFLISTVLFLLWVFRAYGQLGALGIARPRYKRGWAIASWFVPLLNLIRPLQIVNDIWRSGDETDTRGAAWNWEERDVSRLIGWWWFFWLVSTWTGQLAFRSYDDSSNDALRTALLTDALAQGVAIPAAILAILVIKRATARQDARAAQLTPAGEPSLAPTAGSAAS